MPEKPLVALFLLSALLLAACQAQNGSGTSDAKSDTDMIHAGPAGGGGGGGY